MDPTEWVGRTSRCKLVEQSQTNFTFPIYTHVVVPAESF